MNRLVLGATSRNVALSAKKLIEAYRKHKDMKDVQLVNVGMFSYARLTEEYGVWLDLCGIAGLTKLAAQGDERCLSELLDNLPLIERMLNQPAN